jgi:hypothetical protein
MSARCAHFAVFSRRFGHRIGVECPISDEHRSQVSPHRKCSCVPGEIGIRQPPPVQADPSGPTLASTYRPSQRSAQRRFRRAFAAHSDSFGAIPRQRRREFRVPRIAPAAASGAHASAGVSPAWVDADRPLRVRGHRADRRVETAQRLRARDPQSPGRPDQAYAWLVLPVCAS